MEFTQGPVATEGSEVWLLFPLDLDEGIWSNQLCVFKERCAG